MTLPAEYKAFFSGSGTKLGSGADTWGSGLTLKVALKKGVLLRTNVEKEWKDRPLGVDWSVHKQKRNLS